MEFADVLRRRRMVRSFEDTAMDADALMRVLDAARRAPSAGFTQAVDFVVLEGPAQTARYWDVALADPERRARFPWPGVLVAPVLVVVIVDPSAYVRRYAEPDKSSTGLGDSQERWPVPYWWVDAGMAAMAALFSAVDEGFGSLFFGLFEHEEAVLRALGVPSGRRAAGTVALGHPSGVDRPTGSAATRPRRAMADVVHRGGW